LDDVKVKSFDPFKYQNYFHTYELKFNEAEIKQITVLLKKEKTGQPKTTYDRFNILNFPLLKNIRAKIIDILEEKNLSLGNNWAQLYNKKDKHNVHIHAQSDYSGIIYLNPNKPSPTIFYSKNFERYVHKGIKNTLLLFPSHIPHEVESLNKDEERLIISFNTIRNFYYYEV
jgi:hypothetical protein|tara:strand:+ start:211 stop:726 length:516 start_codon:yes stop_codon:yes gene_type:complete